MLGYFAVKFVVVADRSSMKLCRAEPYMVQLWEHGGFMVGCAWCEIRTVERGSMDAKPLQSGV